MQEESLRMELTRLEAAQPKPQIGVGLVDRNRVRLLNWSLLADCLVERWPGGGPRYLIPLGQIVLIEVQEAAEPVSSGRS